VSAAAVMDRQVLDAFVCGEELRVLGWSRKVDLCCGESALGGIENDTRDGDIGAECHATQNKDPVVVNEVEVRVWWGRRFRLPETTTVWPAVPS